MRHFLKESEGKIKYLTILNLMLGCETNLKHIWKISNPCPFDQQEGWRATLDQVVQIKFEPHRVYLKENVVRKLEDFKDERRYMYTFGNHS